MKVFFRIFSFLVLTVCFSCEEQGWIIYCSDCVSSEPESATLDAKLKVTDNPVTVNVYEGFLEDSILYTSKTTNNSSLEFTVTLNKTYTVTATYIIDGKKYIAVDSATPRVRYDKDKCDDPCYYTYDKTVNLRLKSTAKD